MKAGALPPASAAARSENRGEGEEQMGVGRFALGGWSRRRSVAGLIAVLGLGLIIWAVSLCCCVHIVDG